MDVKSAFLNGDLKEEVFVEQPEGFVIDGFEDHVYLLHKALYGLKQAPRAWYQKIDNYLLSLSFELSFERSHCDSNLYVLIMDGAICIIVLYVDDLKLTGSDDDLVSWVQTQLKSTFSMTDLGLLHYFLDLEVWQFPTGIFICQKKYLQHLLERYGMQNCSSLTCPMYPNSKLSLDDDSPEVDSTLYRQLIGSLLYLANTRPDLSFSMSILSQFSTHPRRSHWQAAIRVLRYLRGTLDYGLHYAGGDVLVGYSDSDWAGCVDTRRSTTGYCFMFGSGLISWKCQKQPTTARSSTEAEYRSYMDTISEALWLRQLLDHLVASSSSPTVIYSDSQSAIALAHNPVIRGRTKHIDVHYHFVRDYIEEGREYVPTRDNIADLPTKPLPRPTLDYLLQLAGVGSPIWS